MPLKKIFMAVLLTGFLLFITACTGDMWDGTDIIYLTGDVLDTTVPTDDSTGIKETGSIDTNFSAIGSDTTDSTATDDADVSETASNDNGVDEKTVYWVPDGKVWHNTDGCSSLSRSKNILSGTVNEAILAGKDRACKRCD